MTVAWKDIKMLVSCWYRSVPEVVILILDFPGTGHGHNDDDGIFSVIKIVQSRCNIDLVLDLRYEATLPAEVDLLFVLAVPNVKSEFDLVDFISNPRINGTNSNELTSILIEMQNNMQILVNPLHDSTLYTNEKLKVWDFVAW